METITFDLTKVVHFHELKPYGRFIIKWKTRQGHKPRIIPLDELKMEHVTCMPVDDEIDKKIIKFMLKHKTDILTDGNHFYTRFSEGFGRVDHEKLRMYRDDEAFRSLVDNNE